MAGRKMPTAKPAVAVVPSEIKTVGPSRKPKVGAAKSPKKSNLSAKVQRTSDLPKSAGM